jgi:hypothetical protein
MYKNYITTSLVCLSTVFVSSGITYALVQCDNHYSCFAETHVPPPTFNGSLGAGTAVSREEQERLSTPLHVHVDPVSLLHMYCANKSHAQFYQPSI